MSDVPTYTPYQLFQQMDACQQHLMKALTKACDRRNINSPGWERKEQEAVMKAANQWAQKHGLPHVSLNQIVDAEHPAVGHVDWGKKFCLYVTELLYKEVKSK